MKLPKALFWLEQVDKIIWAPFWWVILFVIILVVPFLRVWWWLFLPLMLVKQLETLYLWWLGWDYDYAKQKWIVLEIIPPKEVLAPFKAMEDVFTAIWPVWDNGNFRERWCDGELDNTPFWCSWEIASIEGRVHFYLRCLQGHRLMIEVSLYAHYPDLEIAIVPDYVKLVPKTVPNEEWDIYGEDFITDKDPAYPIRTYEKFFEPQGERISAEEKRIDPIIGLLEAMSRLGPGEHYWMQFITIPMNEKDYPNWKNEGERIIGKLSKRPEKKKTTFMDDVGYLLGQLILGPKKEGSGDKAKYEWVPQQKEETGEREMVLTPGEREIITEIENKLKKPVYRVVMRGVYVAKRENWKAAHRIIARSYFSHFASQNLNHMHFDGRTRPRIHYFWRKRRVFLRARRMFRNAVLRFTPLYPNREEICPILNTEELATLFHFPLRITGMVAPTMGKIESKKAGPPPNLPI